MSVGTRFFALITRVLPILIFVGIAVLMLTGEKNPHRDLISDAEFTDVNEDGDIAVMKFVARAPDAIRLGAMPAIAQLTIEDAEISVELGETIANIPQLRSLSVAGCEVADQVLRCLDGHRNLKELNLSGASDLSAVLPTLDLPELKTLKLTGCSWVDDTLVSQLSCFSKLQSVDVSRTGVTSDGIKSLSALPGLNWLECLHCSGLTDETFPALMEMPQLLSVRMSGTKFSLKAIRDFQQVRPTALLYVPMIDIPELKPILERSERHFTEADLVSTGIAGLSVRDETGIDYSPLLHFQEMRWIQLSGSGITDDTISFLAGLPGLTSLRLSDSKITGLGLRHISQLKNLSSLDLSQTAVGDDGTKHLSGLAKLSSLDISHTLVSDAGMEPLRNLKNLEYLNVTGLALFEQGLKVLRDLPKLSGTLDLSAAKRGSVDLQSLSGKGFREVNLSGQSLSYEGMEVIKSWKNLQFLDLSHTGVTGEYIDLSQNPRLHYLKLDGTRVTDASLMQMKLPPQLRSLSLADTSVQGKCLEELARRNVRDVNLSSTSVSPAAIQKALSLHFTSLELLNIPVDVAIPKIAPGFESAKRLTLDAGLPLFRRITEAPGAEALTELKLHNASSASFSQLSRLKHLSSITFVGGTFAEGDFLNLGKIRSIGLHDCAVAEAAIADLGRLSLLHSLSVRCPQQNFFFFDQLKHAELQVNWIEPQE